MARKADNKPNALLRHLVAFMEGSISERQAQQINAAFNSASPPECTCLPRLRFQMLRAAKASHGRQPVSIER